MVTTGHHCRLKGHGASRPNAFFYNSLIFNGFAIVCGGLSADGGVAVKR